MVDRARFLTPKSITLLSKCEVKNQNGRQYTPNPSFTVGCVMKKLDRKKSDHKKGGAGIVGTFIIAQPNPSFMVIFSLVPFFTV